jgi:hypothetical protein
MWSVPSGLRRSRALGVDGVVEHDRVQDQSERDELFFLALAVALP